MNTDERTPDERAVERLLEQRDHLLRAAELRASILGLCAEAGQQKPFGKEFGGLLEKFADLAGMYLGEMHAAGFCGQKR